jgi:VWFA-related protein
MPSSFTRVISTLGVFAVAGLVCGLAVSQRLSASAHDHAPTSSRLPASQGGQSGQGGQGATIRIGSEEVLLDIVARDKKGRPVNDLRLEDLEVYEDGAKQQINSFRKVDKTGEAAAAAESATGATAPAARPSTPAASGAPAVDPLRQINLVTMIFERLNNDSRLRARDAAREFLKTELRPNTMVAIFALDQRLSVLQQFTNDRDRLSKAIDTVTGAASSQFTSQSEAIQQELENYVQANAGLDAATSNPQQGGGSNIGQAAVAAKLAEVTINTLRMTQDSQRQQQGAASIFSLLSFVREQRRLVGRKTVLYFSEGLQLTPDLNDVFKNMIGAANRANVSFYAIDARGLQTSRQTEQAKQDLDAAVTATQQQQRTRGGQATTPEQVKALGTAESSIYRNAQNNLATLAESTGGFLTADTNDLRSPVKRIGAELASYYEVSYTPSSREYDGKFREIKVRTKRPDVTLQSRSGYFALPPSESGGATVAGFETPLLAALGSAKLPRDFEYRATAMHFAATPEGAQHTLIIEAPLANLTFVSDQEKKTYHTHFSLMALLKNAQGQVAQKFSQDYPLEGPLDRLEALKRGNVVFVRTFTLAPGRYTLETIARDHETNKLSARRSVLIVPPAGREVGLSSISLIKRIDPVDPNVKDPDNPLRFEQGKIIPNLGETVHPGPGAQISFFFVVYPAAGLSDKPSLTLEFMLDGQVVARATPELSPPDASGRIAYITSAPTENFKPGRYELRAVVTQGGRATEEHAFFDIE